MRRAILALLAIGLLLLVAALAYAQGLTVPSAQQLCLAPLVLEGTATRQLAPNRWLFSNVNVLGVITTTVPGNRLPNTIQGWWPNMPQALPISANLLRPNQRLILLMREDYQLLSVYPFTADFKYPGGLCASDFSQQIIDARQVRRTVTAFFDAIANKDWYTVERYFAPCVINEIRASKNLQDYLSGRGLFPQGRKGSAQITIRSVNSTTATVVATWLRDPEDTRQYAIQQQTQEEWARIPTPTQVTRPYVRPGLSEPGEIVLQLSKVPGQPLTAPIWHITAIGALPCPVEEFCRS